ncbi:MAG: hypothetical protein PHH00_01975 [Candidatus Nanoarchaeia archaeon]|nr:hypothetical protein [Candidatus Nanoarchaeia archaeon]
MAKKTVKREKVCDERIAALRQYRHDRVDFHGPEDYISVCAEASRLLSMMDEEAVSPEDLRDNGKGIRRFIVSLQELAKRAGGKDYSNNTAEREVIEIFYEESQEHVGEVEAELSYFVRTHRR